MFHQRKNMFRISRNQFKLRGGIVISLGTEHFLDFCDFISNHRYFFFRFVSHVVEIHHDNENGEYKKEYRVNKSNGCHWLSSLLLVMSLL